MGPLPADWSVPLFYLAAAKAGKNSIMTYLGSTRSYHRDGLVQAGREASGVRANVVSLEDRCRGDKHPEALEACAYGARAPFDRLCEAS
jgi:hypothetical protein